MPSGPYPGYAYIMTNRQRDQFIIRCTADLVKVVREFKNKAYRAKHVPFGKKQCFYLVYWEYHEHAIDALHAETRLSNLDSEALKRFITASNPDWNPLNREILEWRK